MTEEVIQVPTNEGVTDWPQALIVTATYSRRFESEDQVKDIIQQICRDIGVCHPDDEDMKDVQKKDWEEANPDEDFGWEYDDAANKADFASYYPDVTWPPRTLSDLGDILVKDFVDQETNPVDEDFDDPDWESDVVEVPR